VTPVTWLDRAIGWVSPKAGLTRVRARAALQLMRAYEGASLGRRTSGWRTTGASANTEIAGALPRLRARSRDLVRNNPYARRAITHAGGERGRHRRHAGHQERPSRKGVVAVVCEADFHGDHNLYGLQALAARAAFESGDCLIVRVRTTMANAGRSGVPLRSRCWKATSSTQRRLARRRTATTSSPASRWIPGSPRRLPPLHGASGRDRQFPVEGPEQARAGRGRDLPLREGASRAAARRAAPGGEHHAPARRGRVPGSAPGEEEDRGLLRGLRLFDGDDRPLSPSVETETTADGTARRVEKLSPGTIIYGKEGEEVTFGNPSSGPEVGFIADELRAIAMGAGCTYEQLTGDLSNTNYSSMRGGRAEFKILVEQYRWLSFMPQVCERIYGWFEEAAFLAGKIRTTRSSTSGRRPVGSTSTRRRTSRPTCSSSRRSLLLIRPSCASAARTATRS
jgi:hypothetical protein